MIFVFSRSFENDNGLFEMAILSQMILQSLVFFPYFQ